MSQAEEVNARATVGTTTTQNLSFGQRFTTGELHAGGYLVTSAAFWIAAHASTSPAPQLSVALHEAGANAPADKLADLTGSVGYGWRVYTAPAGTKVKADTTYYLVFAGSQNWTSLGATGSDAEDENSSVEGWSIANERNNLAFGHGVSTYALQIQINGRELSTDPTLSGLAVLPGTLSPPSGRRRATR